MPIDYPSAHRIIQSKLKRMAEIAAPDLGLESRPGQISSSTFPLFSYRAFRVPNGRDLESVIAGVTVEILDNGRLRISADISGEESGTIWFEPATREVAADGVLVLEAVADLADQFVYGHEALRTAVADLGAA